MIKGWAAEWLQTAPRPTIPAVAVSAARSDVELQLVNDRNYGASPNTRRARMAAVLEAEKALAHDEPGAAYALRQSLIDVASAAELLAETMPAPVRPRRTYSAAVRVSAGPQGS